MTKNNDKVEQAITPVKYVETLRGGTAHVILFSDGKRYVVKWYGTKKKRQKEVVNEYVVSKLAELLSLPVIPFKLVYIPEEFIKKTPELHKKKKHNYRSGYQYGCEFIENCVVFEDVRFPPPPKSEVKNYEMLAGITVFDHWVNNSDRGTMNVILERLDEGYYVHMIDHGRVFPGGYQWSAATLKEKPVYNFHWPFYKWVISLLDDYNELTSFIDKIVDLPNESIYEVIQSIPKEWNIKTEDKEALYKFLLGQKEKLPEIVDDIIHYYRNRESIEE